jgi:hypothetical protein
LSTLSLRVVERAEFMVAAVALEASAPELD